MDTPSHFRTLHTFRTEQCIPKLSGNKNTVTKYHLDRTAETGSVFSDRNDVTSGG